MLGLGMSELIIILVIVLVIFGAGKLPEIGGSLGKSIKSFKKAVEGEEKDEEAASSKETEDKSK